MEDKNYLIAREKLEEALFTGILNVPNLGLSSLEWTLSHPKIDEVKIVYCGNNKLTSLPLWKSVEKVDCKRNKLTSLPFWKSVEEIYCSFNFLEILPKWGNIEIIDCSNNRLISLPKWDETVSIACLTNKLYFLDLLSFCLLKDNPILFVKRASIKTFLVKENIPTLYRAFKLYPIFNGLAFRFRKRFTRKKIELKKELFREIHIDILFNLDRLCFVSTEHPYALEVERATVSFRSFKKQKVK